MAIDFENANWSRESACSVGMSLVRDGRIADRFSTYVKPPGVGGFHPFNTSIHGITANTVANAPEWPQALARMLEFADGRPLVAHNAGFDMSVIRNACTATRVPWPELRYACTLMIARRTWQLLAYRLPHVAEAAGVALGSDTQGHADTAAEILLAAMRLHGVDEVDDLLDTLRIRLGHQTAHTWTGAQRVPPSTRRGLFYGLNVCLTGQLTTMPRIEAQYRLAEAGAQAVPGVTSKTDVLVVGTPEPDLFVPGRVESGEQRVARDLLDRGHRIEVIGEVDFLRRLCG